MNTKNLLALAIALFCTAQASAEEFKVTNKSGREVSASISTCKEVNGDKTCTYSPAKKIPSGETAVFNITKPNDNNTYSYWLSAGAKGGVPLNKKISIPGSFEIKPEAKKRK